MTPAATILIPTWNSPLTLRYALTSALKQTERDIEILVVGDGVSDASREIISVFQEADDRVTFLDLPKGENRGERNRHEGVLSSRGEVIFYLADDDILMPKHVQNLLNLIEAAPFVQSYNTYVDSDNQLQLYPTDLSDLRWIAWHLEEPPRNRVSITGTAHTKKLYEQLADGWNVAPPGMWTDLFLWRQFFQLPDFRGATHKEATALQFPAPYREKIKSEELVALYESWFQFSQSHDGHERLQQLVKESAARTLVELSAGFDSRGFQIATQLDEIGSLHVQSEELKTQIMDLEAAITRAEEEHLKNLAKIERLISQLREVRSTKRSLEETLFRVRSSVFWKLSRPLRWLRRKVLERT